MSTPSHSQLETERPLTSRVRRNCPVCGQNAPRAVWTRRGCLVVASPQRCGFDRGLIEATDGLTRRHEPCLTPTQPAMAARRQSPFIIVVGADFLRSDGEAMWQACELIHTHEYGEVHPVHVGRDCERFEWPTRDFLDTSQSKEARLAKRQLNEQARAPVSRYEEASGRRFQQWVEYVRAVPTERALLRVADELEADLLIIQTSQPERRPGILTRAVLRGLLNDAHCPLLFVGAEAASKTGDEAAFGWF